MIEAEVKIKITDVENVEEALINLGFQYVTCMLQEDLYFDNQDDDIRSSGKAMRIRTVTNLQTNESLSQITFDVITNKLRPFVVEKINNSYLSQLCGQIDK